MRLWFWASPHYSTYCSKSRPLLLYFKPHSTRVRRRLSLKPSHLQGLGLHSFEGILLRDFLKSARSHLTLAAPQALLAFVTGNTLLFLITNCQGMNGAHSRARTAVSRYICCSFLIKDRQKGSVLLHEEIAQGKFQFLWAALNTAHLSVPIQ